MIHPLTVPVPVPVHIPLLILIIIPIPRVIHILSLLLLLPNLLSTPRNPTRVIQMDVRLRSVIIGRFVRKGLREIGVPVVPVVQLNARRHPQPLGQRRTGDRIGTQALDVYEQTLGGGGIVVLEADALGDRLAGPPLDVEVRARCEELGAVLLGCELQRYHFVAHEVLARLYILRQLDFPFVTLPDQMIGGPIPLL